MEIAAEIPHRWGTVPAARVDPRWYQIGALGSLLAYGLAAERFEAWPAGILTVVGVTLGTQFAMSRVIGLPRTELRSALITALSLCLLLRTQSLTTATLAGVIAISSKFLLRRSGRHLFNPSALAIGAVLVLRDDAWVSAVQWGSVAFFGLLVACGGGFVVSRALRSDVALAFLGFHAAILFGRAWWLGDPLAIPLHQLQTGALLIFAFFMISDPRTTPATRGGRIVFAGLVAGVAGLISFHLFGTNAPIWALLLCAPTVPLIDFAIARTTRSTPP